MAKSVCSDRKGICHLSIYVFVVAIEKLCPFKELEAKLFDLNSEGEKEYRECSFLMHGRNSL